MQIRQLVVGALMLSASANAWQAYQLSNLTKTMTALAKTHNLQEGEQLPVLSALVVSGKGVTTVGDSLTRPLVLYWMNPKCPWCQKNETAFRSLVSQLRESHDVVAVSSTLDGLDAFVAQTNPPYDVVGPPTRDALEADKFGGTPMTVVLSADRSVLKVWNGAYDDASKREIERFFGVKLSTTAK